jgi:hypothetical protein
MNKLSKKLKVKRSLISPAMAICAIGLFTTSLQSCSVFSRIPRIKIVKDSDGLDDKKLLDSSVAAIKAPVVADTSIKKKELIKSTEAVWNRKLEYNTFSGKAKMQYDYGEKSLDFVANIRIRKDSAIWISVSAFGGVVQVARALITPDSFKAIVYIEKDYYSGPVSRASEFLPTGIDFFALQNMLMGDPVFRTATATDATDFGGTWSFRFENDNYLQQLNYSKADSTLRNAQIATKGDDFKAITILYGNYERLSGQPFSDLRKINALNGDKHVIVDMNYVSTGINMPLDFPFSVPKNYTRK